MGIDIHALNFLRYVTKKRKLGRVATIGRQSLLVSRRELARVLGVPWKDTNLGLYSEELLKKHFGATHVDSYDYSGYEGATHVADLGRPIVPEQQYDTVIDCGTAEHIFDVSQVLRNLSCLCASGGQIVHVLPANNFCGHGFWQFSPELFFSLYSNASGYSETEVFLADLRDKGKWFEVEQPKHGRRAEVISSGPLYVMCMTTKLDERFPKNIQQSDYVYWWNRSAYTRQHQSGLVPTLKRTIKTRPSLYRFAVRTRVFAKRVLDKITNPTCLSDRNRHLRKFNVSDLLMG
jgi:hypothetical protein